MGAGYPVFEGMLSVYVASVFDQRFRGERSVTVDLQGTSVPAIDVFSQDGSVSTLNVDYARQISGNAAVGLTMGRYAGTVARTLTRTFGDSTLASEAQPYQSAGSWAYSGYLVTGGVDVDLTRAVSVAGERDVVHGPAGQRAQRDRGLGPFVHDPACSFGSGRRPCSRRGCS